MFPGVTFNRSRTRRRSQTLAQLTRPSQTDYRISKFADIAGFNQQRCSLVLEHFANLAEAARDYPLGHGHVFEEFRRRAKELGAGIKRHMRRHEQIASVEQLRHPAMSDGAQHHYAIKCAALAQNFLNYSTQCAVANQQKTDRTVARNLRNRLG